MQTCAVGYHLKTLSELNERQTYLNQQSEYTENLLNLFYNFFFIKFSITENLA